MSQSNIIYEHSQVSFSCCVSPKHSNTKSTLNHFVQHQNDRDRKDKKISLKKYHQTHMKSTEYRLSFKESATAGTHLKTTRFSDISEAQKIANTPTNQLWTANRFATERHSLNLKTDPGLYFDKIEQRLPLPKHSNADSKILAKTTIERIQPAAQDLKKSLRGGTRFNKIKKLSSLKESVYSYSGSGQQRQRMQQSQIMLDFFHPSVTRLNAIETLIKDQSNQPQFNDKSPTLE